jgi:hypothetical protein
MKRSQRKSVPKPKTRAELAAEFAPMLQGHLAKRGWKPDDVVRHSPILKSVSVRRWIDALRFPEPQFMIYLADALSVSVDELIRGLDVSQQYKQEVTVLQGMRSEARG